MPSPFPGMDPYLEEPALWPSVHQALITFIWSSLNTLLPSDYVASIGERIYIVQPRRDIYPDIAVLRSSSPSEPAPEPLKGGTTATALADPPVIVKVEPFEVREVFVEIVLARDPSQVITVIEVLSPSNKDSHHEGHGVYKKKQQALLESQTNLLEIDLLRHGTHTVAVPREELLDQHGRWDYLVCLHRGGQGSVFETWPFTLRQPLPRIWVPLTGKDPDVVLDLQAVFTHCYESGAFARRIDYRQSPPIPLRPEDAAWIESLLKEKGLK